MNTTASAAAFERSKKVSPGGVQSPVRGFRNVGGTPRFIRSAKGSMLEDIDGNRYVDFCLAWGPMVFGHQDPDIAEAIRAAVGRGWSYGAADSYSLELAELITGAIPWVEKIRFVNSGTEAVMSAIRVARAATGRKKIIKFEGCYHGHVDSMLVKGGSALAEPALPDSAGVLEDVAADTLLVPLNDLAAVESLFYTQTREIAAVIVEGVPANNGLLLQSPEFLKKLAELTSHDGALLILDEVITGFRVAFGGMAEVSHIKPDLVTYGKVLGGGLPVGAFGGRADLMDLVAPAGPVFQAGTFCGNPVVMSAGIATLRKLQKSNPYRELAEKTELLSVGMESAMDKAGVSGRVQRLGSLFWPVFGEINSSDGVVRTPLHVPWEQKEQYGRVFHQLLEKGIFLSPSGLEVSFVGTNHTDAELHQLITAFEESLGK